ncbi:hypothetical protein [Anaerobiospirillum sp. NML120511]|uniref:hypothetical protein n=1 Tax=Anaerobiospirillum sp. NML120511 TaxID=2932819 RepID=UPI001FF3AC5D|nr:hypothetical protein [Anaerobiospirillum sp. NML120511]MCK0533993.1 hypothetical protein [Anaerobiospirillum sp. NML120511]
MQQLLRCARIKMHTCQKYEATVRAWLLAISGYQPDLQDRHQHMHLPGSGHSNGHNGFQDGKVPYRHDPGFALQGISWFEVA